MRINAKFIQRGIGQK